MTHHGLQLGWFSECMSINRMASRFKAAFLKLALSNDITVISTNRIPHLKCFGLASQSGFYRRVKFDSYFQQWFVFAQSAKHSDEKGLVAKYSKPTLVADRSKLRRHSSFKWEPLSHLKTSIKENSAANSSADPCRRPNGQGSNVQEKKVWGYTRVI